MPLSQWFNLIVEIVINSLTFNSLTYNCAVHHYELINRGSWPSLDEDPRQDGSRLYAKACSPYRQAAQNVL